MSHVNPGLTMFNHDIDRPLYRGLNHVVVALVVRMARGRRPRRVLDLQINIYSTGMRAARFVMRVHLARGGLTVRRATSEYLY